MRLLRRVCVAVAGVLAFSTPAHADVAKARLIQKGLAAFECSIFAAFISANGESDSQRLFQVGYDSSMAFLEAVSAGQVSEEEYRSFVRMDVALNLKKIGSTHPAFSVGRFYQDVRTYAGNQVMYGRTATGAIDFNNTLSDAQSAAVAKKLYDQNRCALID